MQLGKLGVFQFMDVYDAASATAFARRVEGWGYGALWTPEGMGRDNLALAGCLLAATTRLNVATGIASIYARDAISAASVRNTLAEWWGGRFLLGLGVSHAPIVEGVRRHEYGKPVPTMRAYLQAMAQINYMAPPPATKPLTVIAALGPQMLALAAELADGAHPYNVTPEHTAQARQILGPGKLLCPEQMVALESDKAEARAIGRRALALYLTLPGYRNNWLRGGFTEADLDGGGSDRLIDAIVAWGDEDAIRARIQAHLDAGADHVCIQPLGKGAYPCPADERVLALFAPARQ